MKEDFGVGAAVRMVEFRGVDGDRVFDFAEKVFVIDDVAKVFVFSIETVGATDGLEKPVVLHTLINVEVGAAWGIKTCEQLIYDDQQLHVGGLGFELIFSV